MINEIEYKKIIAANWLSYQNILLKKILILNKYKENPNILPILNSIEQEYNIVFQISQQALTEAEEVLRNVRRNI